MTSQLLAFLSATNIEVPVKTSASSSVFPAPVLFPYSPLRCANETSTSRARQTFVKQWYDSNSLSVFISGGREHVSRADPCLVGYLAQKRLARGLQLNHTEATALIASQLLEFMRDGTYTVSQLMDLGKQMLGRRHVMPEVLDTLQEVQVEGTFPDGTFLVTVHDPICTDHGNLEMALYGSFLPIPDNSKFPLPTAPRKPEDAPGAVIIQPGKIELNQGRRRVLLVVYNQGDRPIQVKGTESRKIIPVFL